MNNISKSIQNTEIEKNIIVLSIIYNLLMVIYELLNPYIVIIVSLLFFVVCIVKLKMRFSYDESLLYCSFFLIPTSFVSVLATNYSVHPITYFHISIIIMSLFVFIKSRIKKTYFFYVMLLFLFFIYCILIVPNYLDALKQVLTTIFFFLSFYIGEYFYRKNSKSVFYNCVKLYCIVGVTYALQVLLQKIIIENFGIVIGHFAFMGLARNAFAALMMDYSFASLYLATIAIVLFLYYKINANFNFNTFFLTEIIVIYSMVITSARTGLVALIFTIIFALYRYIKSTEKNKLYNNLKKKKIYVCGVLIGIIYVIYKILALRKGQSFFDGSGRIDDYIVALNIFKNNWIAGIGFGRENYVNLANRTIPHNFFIQYLAQSGVIGTFIITFPFIYFINRYLINYKFKYVFLCVFLGAMFIPDIISSRFLYALVIIGILSKNFEEEK